MPAEGTRPTAQVAGLGAVGLAVCCGLPVLLSVGAGVTVAGLGLRSWLLAFAGLVVVAGGVGRYRRRERCAVPGDDRAGR